MPEPVRDAKNCSLEQLPEDDREVTLLDLFKKKRVQGWWPVYAADEGIRDCTVSWCTVGWLVLFIWNTRVYCWDYPAAVFVPYK